MFQILIKTSFEIEFGFPILQYFHYEVTSNYEVQVECQYLDFDVSGTVTGLIWGTSITLRIDDTDVEDLVISYNDEDPSSFVFPDVRCCEPWTITIPDQPLHKIVI